MGGGGSKPAQKVLIAVDGSQHSQQAFDWYRTNLATPNDEIVLFHSACLPAYLAGPTGVPASPIDVERAAESLRRRVGNLESNLLGQCQKHSLRCRWRFADAFDAGAAVVDAAADENVGMVVMGTRGLGTIRRTILGSEVDQDIKQTADRSLKNKKQLLKKKKKNDQQQQKKASPGNKNIAIREKIKRKKPEQPEVPFKQSKKNQKRKHQEELETGEDDNEESELEEEPEQKKQKVAEQKPRRVLTDAEEGRTIFARNVNFSTTAEALRDFFETSVGPVEECRIVRDRLTEHSRGQAFIKFRSKTDADSCLLRWAADPERSFRLDGSTLRLCLAVTRDRLAQIDKTPATASAAAALAANELRRKASAGKRNLHLARAGQLRRGSREAEGVPEAELVLREQLEKRAREALRNPDVMISPTRLCVHGLPRELTDLDLRRAFQRLGGPGCRVIECRIMRDTARLDAGDAQLAPGAKVAGRSRGFGFVAFGDHEHAARAVEAARVGPSLPNGRRLVVQFSLERQSALRKKLARSAASTGGTASASGQTSGGAVAVTMTRIPKPDGVQGGIPKAPKRRARDGAGAGVKQQRQRQRLEARRQQAGRLSRKEFRRKRKEALIREGRLK